MRRILKIGPLTNRRILPCPLHKSFQTFLHKLFAPFCAGFLVLNQKISTCGGLSVELDYLIYDFQLRCLWNAVHMVKFLFLLFHFVSRKRRRGSFIPLTQKECNCEAFFVDDFTLCPKVSLFSIARQIFEVRRIESQMVIMTVYSPKGFCSLSLLSFFPLRFFSRCSTRFEKILQKWVEEIF